MKRNSKILVWFVTAVFAITLIILIGNTIILIQKQTEESCFSYLDEATHRLANELYRTTDMDKTVLTAMATIIASETDQSDENLCKIMNSYESVASYVSYVELLRPDGTMLDANGSVRNVSDDLNFDTEVQKGAYISDIAYSTKDSSARIVRNAVPVVLNGETIFMLYGVVDLSEFSKTYTTNIYGGNAYVYLENGDTGEFLLDTWHQSFGNISDFYDREHLSKESFQDAGENMKHGIPGDLTFRSQSTGDILYMHYEPVGVNNWNVIITVQDIYALQNSKIITSTLYRMAIIAGIIVLLYMIFVIALMIQAYRHIHRLGMNDKVTGLQNRNAYDAFITNNQNKSIAVSACVYADINGLHELNNREGHEAGDRMLRNVAEALKTEFPANAVFRAGGDEFVVIMENMDENTCSSKMKRVNDRIIAQGYSIAYGISVQTEVTGFSETIHLADEKMLDHKKLYYSMHDRRER